VQTIIPLTPLPVITRAVTIDAYTQRGASRNTLAAGDNATLLIDLSGENDYYASYKAFLTEWCESSVTVLNTRQPEKPFECGQQPFPNLPILGDEFVCTSLFSSGFGGGTVVGSNDDHDRWVFPVLDGASRLYSIQTRHVDVHQDQVGGEH
jgi:hypothetical protein